ncbi:MAG TPA: peptidylprolyl isomerase [Candidatus Eisenbacteria bacterium]|nr:peptidylprolyl isomerase [Candidatus Eisenbacteria bacterium]
MKLPSIVAVALALAAAAPAVAQAPAATTPAATPAPKRLDGIAATVNNDVVLQSDVEEQLYLFLMSAQQEVDSATVDTLRSQILNRLIDEKVIVTEATRQGITVPEAEIIKQAQDAIADAKTRYETQEAFVEALRKEDLTEEKLLKRYQDEARRAALVQRLVQKQIVRKKPTQAEAETFFKANRDKFPKAPAELRLSVIQIPIAADSAVDKATRARAEAIRKRITGGEKFAKVAAETSDDQASARAGGDLGYLPSGGMDPNFERAVFSRKLNTVGEPVRSVFGWHVIEVLDRDTLRTRAGRDSLDRNGKKVLEAHVRHVLLRVPLTEQDRDRALALATRVQKEATSGKDFGALVTKYSKFAGPHGDNGDVGFLPMSALQPNIRAGLDTVKVGGISDVLQNQAGYNIFMVTERKAEREYSLEEIKDELPQAVSEIQFREKLDEWVKTLRAKAHIQINKS